MIFVSMFEICEILYIKMFENRISLTEKVFYRVDDLEPDRMSSLSPVILGPLSHSYLHCYITTF